MRFRMRYAIGLLSIWGCVLVGCVIDSEPDGDDEVGYGCSTTCGLNAYCDATGSCVCEAGTVPVCGTGDCLVQDFVCDGFEDCANGADEAQQNCLADVEQDWWVGDGCVDGLDVQWRLWSPEFDWTW